jgi:putative peptide zinc metalloprotease protein
VTRGQVLIECDDPLLRARSRVLRARLEELQGRYDEAYPTDFVQALMLREGIANGRAALDRALEQLRELAVVSPTDGLFILPHEEDLPGLHLGKGDLVGYVLDVHRPTVRVVVPQWHVDLVRTRARGVEVRMADRITRVLPARILREVPEAEERLPSTVLSHAGGGGIATDPFDRYGTKAFESLFQFDVEPVEPVGAVYVGGRAFVRFDLGPEPAGFQAWRRLRQLFLKRFNV